ncbi:MAG: cell division ATP-binding protein FtsE [Candidatus Nomurabacteria bacterium]|nr:cell division ATP-binding protein FtsE [Candidatus Nomurabacteria bacterium]
MIHFENVSKLYDGKDESLKDVTFSVEAGEFVSLVGHSGAGKTTIMKLITAEEHPTNGEIYFDEEPIHDFKRSYIPKHRRRIGTIFQDFQLLPQKTVYENVAFAMEVAGKSDKEIKSDVPYALELVNLGDKELRFPHQLSGGEKQRLAIARAIINQPDVILADEPTGNLDSVASHDVVQILKKINELGTTIIVATHDSEVIKLLHNRVITLEKGEIISDSKK